MTSAVREAEDEALAAVGGPVTGTRRAEEGQNERWIVTVRP